ncbi:MAG: aldehyde dehydrogenase family protein [Oscillospiraceae bacterium]|nr:aldehyde dehydrogenase family protein [Oscillospiraceae bacterium]
MWTKDTIHALAEKQRTFFRTGVTLDVDWRLRQLKKLRAAVLAHEKELTGALAADLGRSEAEAYFCDVGSTVLELTEAIRGLRRWAKTETHFSGLHNFPSLVTRVYKLPYGISLIISPFNFPVLLSLGVLTASIAGGNTAVIKASSKSPACTAALQRLISGTFPEEYAAVVDGGHDTADLCLEERFDKIFYTGSPAVGRHVLEAAAKNLTPAALELGGETGNWCVVRKDADLRDAARKIAFFKLCNSGQICIDINQVAVAEEAAEEFLTALKAEFTRQIGPDALKNPEYPRLISEAAWDKCAREAEAYRDRIVYGGRGDRETLRFQPTVIWPVDADEPIVRHELFSPLLPVVPFPDAEVDRLMDVIGSREHGLALYLFTRDIRWAKRVMSTQQYGGGGVNEVCQHLMVKGVPFNGVGHSGMGAYHGEWGFREFTHPSAVMFGSRRFNLPLREHPYTDKKLSLIRKFER